MPTPIALAELATYNEIHTSHVGGAATPSASYAAYRRVVDGATRDDVLALLSSPHAVTRAYMATHVLKHWPDDVGALYPLLYDNARIVYFEACSKGVTTLGGYVFSMLERALQQSSKALEVYLAATIDPSVGAFRARGLSLLLRRDPDVVREQALAYVRAADNEGSLWVSLQVLEKLARPEDIPILAIVVDHPERKFRNLLCEPIARLARTCGDARALLDRLLNDPVPHVRDLARDAAQRYLG